MHDTALDLGRRFFETYPVDPAVRVPSVVDVGGLDVNGSLRSVAPSRYSYCSVDTTEGPGVDLVAPDPYQLPIATGAVDLVVSTSVFEHVEMFWVSFLEMLRILKPSGLLYLNAPSNGMVHRHPVDCWRFYPDGGVALQNWAWRSGYGDVRLLESFTHAPGPMGWRDFVAVFAATPLAVPERRLLDGIDSHLISDGYRFDWKPEPEQA